MEVTVIAAVSSIIFLILLRWLISLTSLSTASIETAPASRDGAYVDSAFSTDIGAASPCEDGGPILVELTAARIGFHIKGNRADGTSGPQLISWSADSGGAVTRSVTDEDAATGVCLPVAAPRTAVMSTLLWRLPSSSAAFTGYAGGTPSGDCVNGEGYACTATTVKLHLFFLTPAHPGQEPDKDSAAILDRTYTLPTSAGG